MACDNGGCVIERRAAARPKCFSSATVDEIAQLAQIGMAGSMINTFYDLIEPE